jgi:hypothetical protein
MLDRIYKPKKNELVYHYCSAETFNAICTFKKIRLCDLFTMNDFLEIHWGYSIWEKVAGELIEDLGFDFIDSIDKIIHRSGLNCLALASCFSSDGDVLSQWRAYADDGNGYVIGFNATELLKLNVKPLRVEYNEKKQIKELKAFIKAIYEVESQQEDDEKYGDDFFRTCSTLSFDLASFKNPAFKEEQEIRLIHLANFIKSNSFLKLEDSGGTYFDKEADKGDIKFLMAKNAPKTYIDIDFTNKGKVNPIKEVIIGPKNDVRETAILVYLETLGIGKVKVKKSKASYR